MSWAAIVQRGPLVSRSAAQAIRTSLASHNIHDAFYILNSVRHSNTKPSSFTKHLLNFTPLEFGCTVPVGLSAHALLHGLVRNGRVEQATREATHLIRDGVRIRMSTLEAITRPQPFPIRIDPSRISLAFSPEMATHRHTQEAVDLVIQARKSRYSKSNRLFRAVIFLCIVNAELAAAAMIYGLLIKDTEAKKGIIKPLVKEVTNILTKNPTTVDEKTMFGMALQAMSHIVSLMDMRFLSDEDCGMVIKAFQIVPSVANRVYIYKDGREEVEAYDYFHSVTRKTIMEYINKPSPDPGILDNLLVYALRTCNDPELANFILDCYDGNPTPQTYYAIAQYAHRIQSLGLLEKVMDQLDLPRIDFRIHHLDGESILRVPVATVKYTPNHPMIPYCLHYAHHLDYPYSANTGIAEQYLQHFFPELYSLFNYDVSPAPAEEVQARLDAFSRSIRKMESPQRILIAILNNLTHSVYNTQLFWMLIKRMEAQSWEDGNTPWSLPSTAYTTMMHFYRNVQMNPERRSAVLAAIRARWKIEPGAKRVFTTASLFDHGLTLLKDFRRHQERVEKVFDQRKFSTNGQAAAFRRRYIPTMSTRLLTRSMELFFETQPGQNRQSQDQCLSWVTSLAAAAGTHIPRKYDALFNDAYIAPTITTPTLFSESSGPTAGERLREERGLLWRMKSDVIDERGYSRNMKRTRSRFRMEPVRAIPKGVPQAVSQDTSTEDVPIIVNKHVMQGF